MVFLVFRLGFRGAKDSYESEAYPVDMAVMYGFDRMMYDIDRMMYGICGSDVRSDKTV